MSEIRLLRQSDISSIMRLNRAAGWNQNEADWDRLIRLQPDGCFGLTLEDEVVATTTAFCYGKDLAWIGMVLTDPAHRGKGYARLLMEHALGWLERRQIAWIKLDATDVGRPLYCKLGFEDEAWVERWVRGQAAGLPPISNRPHIDIPTILDRASFGADRTPLLQDLAKLQSCVLGPDSYALARPGANAAYFGPCVTSSAEQARTLLQWFLGAHADQPVCWDILPDNEAALELAREFGFERRRRLTRQVRRGSAAAEPLSRNDQFVFAIAGFEYG
jgi:GNAT superfamily N-acetyltransferase